NGIEQLKRLSGKDNNSLTLICRDISQVAEYCRIDNAQFKVLKRNLPGAFTFILKASNRLPDKVLMKRSTIGIRIPDNEIVMAILESIESPLISSSLKSDDDIEYTTDAELIHERWGDVVDIVVDGGQGSTTPSTVVDMSEGEVEIIREGEGELI
ncbi:MAG: L-threonylcarbamoyladenylate synthase, partial [Rikenellaceae bacterium]